MHFPVNCHTVGENFSPHGLTSCPDDHPLAVVQVPCSSSCLQPVTQVKSRKLQAMPLVCSDHTHCNKYVKSEVSPVVGISVLAECSWLTGLDWTLLSIPFHQVCIIFLHAVCNTSHACMHHDTEQDQRCSQFYLR